MKSENYIQDFYVGEIVEFTEKAINSRLFEGSLKVGTTAAVIEVERGKFGLYPSKLVILDGLIKGEFQWIDEHTMSREDLSSINFALWFDTVY